MIEYNPASLVHVICHDALTEIHIRHIHFLRLTVIQERLVDCNVRQHQRRTFVRNAIFLRKLLCRHTDYTLVHRVELCPRNHILDRKLRHDLLQGAHDLSDRNNILDFFILQIDIPEGYDIVIHIICHDLIEPAGFVSDECQIITDTHSTDLDILCHDQIILVKQGNLHASGTDIHKCSVLAYNLMKILIFCNQPLEADITLLGITQYLHPDTCCMLNYVKHQIHILRLTYSTRCIGPVLRDFIFVHLIL